MLLDMRRVPKCHARSKGAGLQTAGAPKGNRNALKHGARSAEALALKREIQALARMARETMAAIE